MPRVVFGTGDTDTTLPGAHSLVWLMRKDVEGRNPTHLEKSVANETIQLNSTNSECSQVPSRWGIRLGQLLLLTDPQAAGKQPNYLAHIKCFVAERHRKVMKGP